jgi:hypothetical protein
MDFQMRILCYDDYPILIFIESDGRSTHSRKKKTLVDYY